MLKRLRLHYQPYQRPCLTDTLASGHLSYLYTGDEDTSTPPLSVTLKSKYEHLLSIERAVASAYWLLKHRASIPPLNSLRLHGKPKKPRTSEQRILSALWEIDTAIKYPGICHHPIIDLMHQHAEQNVSLPPPQRLVGNETDADTNSRLLQARLADIHRQMREGEGKKRLDNFGRMARKHHQRLVQDGNNYLISPSPVQVVRLETGYFHRQAASTGKPKTIAPPLQSTDRLITLQHDRDQLLKRLRAPLTRLSGLAGYMWQLIWNPVLGFYLHWWWFFHDTDMTAQERSHLLGDLWRDHIASQSAMTLHDVPKACHSSQLIPEDTDVFSLQTPERLDTLQQQVNAQAAVAYYQQINADFFIKSQEASHQMDEPSDAKPLAAMKRIRTAGSGSMPDRQAAPNEKAAIKP